LGQFRGRASVLPRKLSSRTGALRRTGRTNRSCESRTTSYTTQTPIWRHKTSQRDLIWRACRLNLRFARAAAEGGRSTSAKLVPGCGRTEVKDAHQAHEAREAEEAATAFLRVMPLPGAGTWRESSVGRFPFGERGDMGQKSIDAATESAFGVYLDAAQTLDCC
jgi:hypothetical protein